MTYAISFDWSEELKIPDKWENVGRRVAEESCTHKSEGNEDSNMNFEGCCDECGFSEDSQEPMMNYGYPLETTPDDAKVLEVIKRTNCTVMYDTESSTYYLVLTGGGMDLSQDIALAYAILEQWIPYDLAIEVSTQKGLSIGGEYWEVLKTAMHASLTLYADRAKEQAKRWE